MAKMYTSALLVAGLAAVSAAQSLTSCPSTASQVVLPGGYVYSICNGTDYQGTTYKYTTGIKSAYECAQACQADTTCKKAVFTQSGQGCHLKGNPSQGQYTWAVNAAYTTVTYVSQLTKGQAITTCPYGETNSTGSSGTVYSACPNTDYIGESTQISYGSSSVASCTALCDSTANCKRVVYIQADKVCHLKTPNNDQLQWVYTENYTSVHAVSSASAPPAKQNVAVGDHITSCPVAERNVTLTNGGVATICGSSDYVMNSIEVIQNVNSVEDCANICGSRTTCFRAVFDTKNNVCHTKSTDTGYSWSYNPQFSTIRIATAVAAPATYAKQGKWSDVINFPIIPVAAYVVPAYPQSQRVLVFSSYGARAFSGPTGITQFADYNFASGAVSQRTVTNTKHDMFCPGISSLADGRIVITGGENAEAVSVYDPATNQFTRAADMVIPRGYQTSTTLSDGRIFTIGGSFTGGISNKTGEVYDPVKNTWTLLTQADPTPLLTTDHEGAWRTDNHAWLYGWKNGNVFQAGPSKAMNWYDTKNKGKVSPAGTRNTATDQMCGIHAMYEPGKIFTAAGSQDYTDSDATARAELITITDPGVPATVQRLPDMNFARGFANVAVLPSGQLIITGGQKRSLVFTDVDSVLIPEMFDPVTRTFTKMNPAAIPRNYHAVSLLLPDGTVFVGGGGMCPAAQGDNLDWCDRAKDHFDGEIFSPPYLFNTDGSLAKRPVITALSRNQVTPGTAVTVTMADNSKVSFVAVRMGSATHSVNSDQRRVPLPRVLNASAKSFTVTLPTDPGILIPGPYYLFAMSDKGVPSVAWTFYVKPS